MTDSSEFLVLEMLNDLRNEVASFRTEMRDQFSGLKQRMLTIECSIGGMECAKPEV